MRPQRLPNPLVTGPDTGQMKPCEDTPPLDDEELPELEDGGGGGAAA